MATARSPGSDRPQARHDAGLHGRRATLVPVTVIEAGPVHGRRDAARRARRLRRARSSASAPPRPRSCTKAAARAVQEGRHRRRSACCASSGSRTTTRRPSARELTRRRRVRRRRARARDRHHARAAAPPGVIKRHGFSGFPASARHARVLPARRLDRQPLVPGPRLQGQAHGRAATAPSASPPRNLEVVAVRPEEHVLLVRGAVPGARNGTSSSEAAPERQGASDQ